MARIWDHVPAQTFTAGSIFTFGVEIQADVPITVAGIWYFARPTGAPTVSAVRLYDTLTQVQLASGPGAALTPDAWTLLPFTAAFDADAAVSYTGAIEVSPGDCAYDLGGSLPVTSPDGHVEAVQGRFLEGSHTFPTSTWTGVHGVDVEYELTPTGPNQGTVAVVAGTDIAVAGSRVSAGGGTVVVGAGLAAVGSRRSAGGALLSVGADVAVVGSRVAGGTGPLAVGVRLAVGGWTRVGRPVTRYPFDRDPVPGFPAGRPVRSFSEVPAP